MTTTTTEPETTAGDDLERESEEAAEARGALFNEADYEREDLALPKEDGHGIDRIALAFSGTIMLDRSDPADIDLYRQLLLHRDVELIVEGRVGTKATKGATNKDGNLDVVVQTRSVTVHSVRRPAGGLVVVERDESPEAEDETEKEEDVA